MKGLFHDRFRTGLSLLGVAVGIFSITGAMVAADSLEAGIRSSLESLGSDVLIVEQIPFEPETTEEGHFKWWEYVSRPGVDYADFRYVQESLDGGDSLLFCARLYGGKVLALSENTSIAIKNGVARGRFFTEEELRRGSAVAVMGAEADTSLIRGGKIAIDGHHFTVIGGLAPSGIASITLTGGDGSVIIPAGAARKLPGWGSAEGRIIAKPAPERTPDGLYEDIRLLMRSRRRLSPAAEDNFAINRIDLLAGEFDEIISLLKKMGLIAALFSILAGGVGIAGIMFVSVRERRYEIGLKMAIGARKRVIMLDFLKEAALLSCIGGAAGILLVCLLCAAIPPGIIHPVLHPFRIAESLILSFAIGVVSGWAPALGASRLEPVEALRAE